MVTLALGRDRRWHTSGVSCLAALALLGACSAAPPRRFVAVSGENVAVMPHYSVALPPDEGWLVSLLGGPAEGISAEREGADGAYMVRIVRVTLQNPHYVGQQSTYEQMVDRAWEHLDTVYDHRASAEERSVVRLRDRVVHLRRLRFKPTAPRDPREIIEVFYSPSGRADEPCFAVTYSTFGAGPDAAPPLDRETLEHVVTSITPR